MKDFRKKALVCALLVCALLFPVLFGGASLTTSMAVDILLLTAAASAWNLFSGFTGSISLGHATFYGLGAYASVLGVQDWHLPAEYGPFLLLPLAGLVAGAFSIPLGWVVLRTRRSTFMVMTIAIFFIFQLLASNLQGLTGGSEGIFLPLPAWSADLSSLLSYYATFALLLLTVLVSWLTRRSRFGLILLAVRDDEERARGLGIRTDLYMLGAYALSAALTGMIGAAAISFTGFITPSTAFDQTLDITLVAITFFGGIGSVVGPLVGGLLLGPLQAYLSLQLGASVPGINLVLFGGFLLVVILVLPRGVVPSIRKRLLSKDVSNTGEEATQVVPVTVPFPLQLQPSGVGISTTGYGDLPGGLPEQHRGAPRATYDAPAPVISHRTPTRPATKKLRAPRLEPIRYQTSLWLPGPAVDTALLSWRCPECRKPFLLKGTICYCPRCGTTRSLPPREPPATPVPYSPSHQG